MYKLCKTPSTLIFKFKFCLATIESDENDKKKYNSINTGHVDSESTLDISLGICGCGICGMCGICVNLKFLIFGTF